LDHDQSSAFPHFQPWPRVGLGSDYPDCSACGSLSPNVHDAAPVVPNLLA
jgi:hypothetical protein